MGLVISKSLLLLRIGLTFLYSQPLISSVPRRKRAAVQRPPRPNRNQSSGGSHPIMSPDSGAEGAGGLMVDTGGSGPVGAAAHHTHRRAPAHEKPLPLYPALLGPITARSMAGGGPGSGAHSSVLAAMAMQV